MNDELRKAAQAVVDAWDAYCMVGGGDINPLRAALANNANAAPEQDPVAWQERQIIGWKDDTYKWSDWYSCKYNTEQVVKARARTTQYEWRPLYTSPVAAPQRVWQSLTEVEICDCIYKAGKSFAAHQKGIKGQQLTFADSPDAHLAWALERVLKEKNHG